MGEIVKHLPDIEGEFRAENQSIAGQSSGYFCRPCEYPLLVGDKQCSGCGWVFQIPTVPSEGLDVSWTTLMTKERKLAFEVKMAQERRKKKQPWF